MGEEDDILENSEFVEEYVCDECGETFIASSRDDRKFCEMHK